MKLKHYRDEYFCPDKRNGAIVYSYKPLPDAENAIYEKISDICISMKACDYLDMPDRVDNIVKVGMNDKETAMYKKLKTELFGDRNNRQSLCKPCHDRKIGRFDSRPTYSY